MVNADPQRTPTFTMFANPDFFVISSACQLPGRGGRGGRSASTTTSPGATAIDGRHRQHLARHGRPGVANLGQTTRTWADHTDVRPTMLALLGLKDSYEQDGR